MIGNNIKKIRKSKNMSQKDFANLLKIPVSTLANYENNHREPNIETLNKIAEVLGVTINELAGPKKTILRLAIDGLFELGYTIEKISDETKIPINEINNILNKKSSTIENYIKLFRYLGYENKDIFDIIIADSAIDSIYNNDGTDVNKNLLKSMLLGEDVSLDEMLPHIAEEDKNFINEILCLNALNRIDQLHNKNNSSSVNEISQIDNKNNSLSINELNEEGQKKLIEYSNDLTKIYFKFK